MKGILFNLMESVVERELGEDAWDDVLDAAGLDGAYTSLGSYPDEEFSRCAEAAAVRTGRTRPDFLRWFARRGMLLLRDGYPALFAGHASARTFLEGVQSIVHAEVLKIYPGAEVPRLEVTLRGPDLAVVAYRSPRRMCAYAVGMIEGAADIFGESVAVRHAACMLDGAESCVLECTFGGAGT